MSHVIWRSKLVWMCAAFALYACRPPEAGSGGACDAVRCKAGTHCVDTDGSASCQPDEERVFCGGIAAFACPGGGICEDDPNDNCDPERGGADCGGLCRCLQLALCIRGYVFDSSPEVCACVPGEESPCALVDCRPGARCEAHDGEGVCVSDGSLQCGDATCESGQVCCNDSCGICTEVGGACIQLACEP